MPPKKSKKKKGDKSSSGRKSKSEKPANDVMTFNEVVMTHQLEVKENALKDLKDDIEDLNFRIERQKQRSLFLKKEQNKQCKQVIKQARQKEEEDASKPVVPYQFVEDALKEKLDALKEEEIDTSELKQRVSDLDAEIQIYRSALQELQAYKAQGADVDSVHIKVLKKEMYDMEQSYSEMEDFFNKSLNAIKQEIIKTNSESIAKQKELVSHEVLKGLDKHSEQEFKDNKWLTTEVAIHRNHIAEVTRHIESIEGENIQGMAALFQNNLEDLSDARQFHMRCKEEELNSLDASNLDDDLTDESDHDDASNAHTMDEDDELDWLDNYLPMFSDTLQLQEPVGQTDLQYLCVVGTSKPIHDMSTSMANLANGCTYEPWIVEKEHLQI